MPTTTPLVTFCVPTYRRAAFILETLRSALAQTVTDIEVVVVDDCSPDDTQAIATGIQDNRLRYVRNANNLGVPENLNRAMSLAQGSYLVLLEDHDLLEPSYLEQSLALMDRYPSVGFVATGIVTIDEGGNPRERYVEDLPEFMHGRHLLRRMLTRTDCPFSVTTLVRRTSLSGIEPLFDPQYWWYADQYLWLRLSAKSDFGYVARPLLKMRVREEDHYLDARHWDSHLCLDRIHRDNWRLLHPRPSLKSKLDWQLYEKAKLREMMILRGSSGLRHKRWSEEDDRLSRSYLSTPGHLILRAFGLLPLELLSRLRDLHRYYHRRRVRIDTDV